MGLFGGSSKSSSTTTVHQVDRRIAATDQAIVAGGGSTVTVEAAEADVVRAALRGQTKTERARIAAQSDFLLGAAGLQRQQNKQANELALAALGSIDKSGKRELALVNRVLAGAQPAGEALTQAGSITKTFVVAVAAAAVGLVAFAGRR